MGRIDKQTPTALQLYLRFLKSTFSGAPENLFLKYGNMTSQAFSEKLGLNFSLSPLIAAQSVKCRKTSA